MTATRAYSAPIGRFINRDMIGYRAGVNLYSYVRNMPTRFRDPLGLLVQVGYRSAAGQFQHMVIELTPDNPDDFEGTDLFHDNMATLASEPEFSNAAPWGPFGNMIKTPNDPSDRPCNLHGMTPINPPDGMSDSEFIQALMTRSTHTTIMRHTGPTTRTE
jgi:uncharacterized protein RhaS with RHS repeats